MPTLPPTTKAIILACVAVFCIDSLVRLGAWLALWPLATGQFMPWQVLSYALMHGDVAHLFFNMIGIWLFGSDLERLWGNKRYLQFVVVSVLFAAAAQLLVTAAIGSPVPTVGASGALFGLLLGFAMAFPRRQFDLVGFLPIVLFMVPSATVNLIGFALYIMLLTNRQAVPIPPIPVTAWKMVAIYGAIELFLGLQFRSGVAHFAHLGGMLGGWVMILWWRGKLPFAGKRRR